MTLAKSNKDFCGCPNSEPGKIKIDLQAHLEGCWIRKTLLTKRYTVDTFAVPTKWTDDFNLGVKKID